MQLGEVYCKGNPAGLGNLQIAYAKCNLCGFFKAFNQMAGQIST